MNGEIGSDRHNHKWNEERVSSGELGYEKHSGQGGVKHAAHHAGHAEQGVVGVRNVYAQHAIVVPNGRKEVIATAHELNRKKGVTIILITHYMEEVVDADYVYVMEKGKIVMDGTPRDIFSRVDELKEHRLDVPQATLVADELRHAGVELPAGILTREELVDAIMKCANT